MRSVSIVASVALLTVSSGLTSASAQAAQALPIDSALEQPDFPSYVPLAFSPDGKWVAYTLMYPRRKGSKQETVAGYTLTGMSVLMRGSRVWLTELSTGRTLAAGGDTTTSSMPAWSPDGKWLAFYSDADGRTRLWVREMSTGRERRVSDAIVRASQGVQGPQWTPDSRQIVTPILPYGSEVPEVQAEESRKALALDMSSRDTLPSVTVLRADKKSLFGGCGITTRDLNDPRALLQADIAIHDLAAGTVTTVLRRIWPTHYEVSPDGRYLVVSSNLPSRLVPQWAMMYDIILVPLDNGRDSVRTLLSNAPVPDFGRSLAWSPDGRTLLYSVTDSLSRQEIFAANVTKGITRRVAANGAKGLLTARHPTGFRSLWWDPGGKGFYILEPDAIGIVSMPDGVVRQVIAAPHQYQMEGVIDPRSSKTSAIRGSSPLLVEFWNDSAKRSGFAAVNFSEGTWKAVREENKSYGSRVSIRASVADDGSFVWLSEDSQHPRDIWAATSNLSQSRQVTASSGSLAGRILGAARIVTWRTALNETRRAALLLPAGYVLGKRYPLIVYPYPAEYRSNDVNVFGLTGTGTENMQLLATRGFAVLAPDLPPFDSKNQMREIARIVNSAVDNVIAMGIADSTRLGIMGHSWGGYSVLATITQTPRFAAAVARGGNADVVASYGILQSSGYAFGAILYDAQLGGSLWDVPERYLANSPIWSLNKVQTPLLIIHGEAETTVPIFLANQVFASLQRLGKEVEFARYAGENHTESLWSFVNQRDYLQRMINWFEVHLKAPQ